MRLKSLLFKILIIKRVKVAIKREYTNVKRDNVIIVTRQI
jgi:hypothetical protein